MLMVSRARGPKDHVGTVKTGLKPGDPLLSPTLAMTPVLGLELSVKASS